MVGELLANGEGGDSPSFNTTTIVVKSLGPPVCCLSIYMLAIIGDLKRISNKNRPKCGGGSTDVW